ncbi:multiprotein bridging factor aMBF1 [Candidatus Woesearchaeota archaeon]|nr:multiprotein bridging factor aMBF1 [Candidatus Woesearchaeota archaeon]
MAACDLCGKDTQLFSAIVEGSRLNVCSTCGKFGKVLRKQVVFKKKPVEKPEEPVEVVVSDYAKLIKDAREKKNLTQKDFARFLNEKESVVQKLENGVLVPPLSMARKLEKLLRVKLVEVEEESAVAPGKSSGPLTIGDILNIKK